MLIAIYIIGCMLVSVLALGTGFALAVMLLSRNTKPSPDEQPVPILSSQRQL